MVVLLLFLIISSYLRKVPVFYIVFFRQVSDFLFYLCHPDKFLVFYVIFVILDKFLVFYVIFVISDKFLVSMLSLSS